MLETLNLGLDPWVIRHVFGDGVTPLAYVRIRRPQRKDVLPRLPHERDESDDSQQSGPREDIRQAYDDIMSGQQDMAVAGGVESMSRVGIGASGGAWPMDPSMAVPAYFMPQGVSADLIATKYGFSRDDVDEIGRAHV